MHVLVPPMVLTLSSACCPAQSSRVPRSDASHTTPLVSRTVFPNLIGSDSWPVKMWGISIQLTKDRLNGAGEAVGKSAVRNERSRNVGTYIGQVCLLELTGGQRSLLPTIVKPNQQTGGRTHRSLPPLRLRRHSFVSAIDRTLSRTQQTPPRRFRLQTLCLRCRFRSVGVQAGRGRS